MSEVVQDFFPFIRIYKDGKVERLSGIETVHTSLDPKTNVQSKDVVYSQEANLSSRLYLPKGTNLHQKLPLLVYFHGGAFCIESAFSPPYHNYLNNLVAEANVIAVSVDYRLAPEHPLPFAYDDSWTSLKWVASHVNGNGPEEWLNAHVDFGKVFFAGDSAGGNITYQMCKRCGEEKLAGINLLGIVLVQPFFWGKDPIGNEAKEVKKEDISDGTLHLNKEFVDRMWHMVCPTTSGCDDPLINPITDPKLASLGCSKVLIFVAEKDFLRDRGWLYYEKLSKSGWGGKVEIMEANGSGHVFHLFNPTHDNARAMQKRFVSFLNEKNSQNN